MIAMNRAMIEDPYHVAEGRKAEVVNGEVALGDRDHARRTGRGRAVGDNKAFRVHLPNRESFSPEAAFDTGPRTGMRFFEGAPVFAVEVRGEYDDGPRAERAMEDKRADYFAAGTEVV